MYSRTLNRYHDYFIATSTQPFTLDTPPPPLPRANPAPPALLRVQTLQQFSRTVNEVWRAYEMKQKPAFVLDVRLPPGSFDVNVTPDKREIFMTEASTGMGGAGCQTGCPPLHVKV